MESKYIIVENGTFSATCPFCGQVVKFVSTEPADSPYYRYRGRIVNKCKHFYAYSVAKGKTGISFVFEKKEVLNKNPRTS